MQVLEKTSVSAIQTASTLIGAERCCCAWLHISHTEVLRIAVSQERTPGLEWHGRGCCWCDCHASQGGPPLRHPRCCWWCACCHCLQLGPASPCIPMQPIVHSAPPVMHLFLKLYTFIEQTLGHEAPPSQAQGLPILFNYAKRVQSSPRMTGNEVALDVPAMGITWRRLCSRSAWGCGGRRRRSSGRRRTCW